MATPNSTFTGPNTMNNAVIVGQTRFDPQKFTDKNWLYQNYKKDSFTTYKGLLHLWNQRDIITTPLINMTTLKNNVMYVNNDEGRFRTSIPYNIGLPEIAENLEKDNPRAGMDGQPFKIKLKENAFTNTDIITCDRRDAPQLYINNEEIYFDEDGWVFTVELISSSRRGAYYPQNLMQPGVQYMKIQNINGEYDTQKSSITGSMGMMELETELGSGKRSVTHWITGAADMMKVDPTKDPRLAYLNSRLDASKAVTLYGNLDANGRVATGSVTWHNTIEMLLRAEMEKMTEQGLMWAQGGYVSGGQGRTKVKVATGLYPQLRNGNRLTYNKISLEMIEAQVANLFYNTGIPINQRQTTIMTGQGGLNNIAKELSAKLAQINPYLLQAKDIPGGLFYGDSFNAGFKLPRYTQYFSTTAGYIKFEHNPALDSVEENRLADTIIGEYPISSYTYMILDVTDQNYTNAASRINTKYRVENGFNEGANIVMVKPEGYGELYWGYICGTHSPFGAAGMYGMMSANDYDGYQIWMKSYGTIWVKDVTRTLLIEKARPGFIYTDLSDQLIFH